MSKFHSTVSRRDFMKAVGLGAAGLGAAGAAAPVFHDMDEVIASPQGSAENHPWWVKERPYLDSTTEIDWSRMERYEGGYYDHSGPHLEPEELAKRNKAGSDLQMKRITEGGEPLKDLRALAVKATGWLRPYSFITGTESAIGQQKFIEYGPGAHYIKPPQMRGVPIWQGTPEENSRMMRTICRHMGGTSVGFGELIEGKTKKLVHKSTADWGPDFRIEFEDVDKPDVENPSPGWKAGLKPGRLVFPNKDKYVIVVTIRHSLEATRMSPSWISDGIVGKAYDQIDITQYRIKAFLNMIGYYGIGGTVYGITMRPAWGVLTGLGELGRHHELNTPQWGPMLRTTMAIFTDLPVKPTNPIDAGMNRFCKICTKCADVCPGLAIPTFEEPDYVITDPNDTAGNPDHLKPEIFNNSNGYKRWPLNHFACGQYWKQTDSYCGICIAECVFNKYKVQSIHELVKPIIANTSLLNGFFFNMDKAYGYGLTPEDQWEEWWNKDHSMTVQGDMNY